MTTVEPTFNNPSPPNLLKLLDSLREQVKKEINSARVGVIQSFDAAKQEVTVKIAQQQVTSIKPDGTRTLAEYPLLLRVPVVFPSGGGFTMTFPIDEGDECLVVFNDRQLDNWLTSGPGLPPSMGRVHDLSDGIAIVGLRSNPRALSSVSTNSVQLRSDSGSTLVEVAGGGVVRVVAPTKVRMETPLLEVTGDVVAGTISLQHHIHDGVMPGGGNTGEPVT
jgi:hypothetical protein